MDPTLRRRRGGGPLTLTAPPASRPGTTPVVDLVPIRDVRLARPAGSIANGIAAADAIDAALRDQPATAIGVIGRAAEDVADWLRQSGREAAVIALPRRKNARPAAAARPRRNPPVIVALEWLEHEQDPCSALRAIRDRLGSDGRLIVVVPNLTHASCRLAMLRGQHPLVSTYAAGAAHLCCANGAERLLDDAGFTVTAVERQLDSADRLQAIAGGMPGPVLDLLAGDPDALTSHFALTAHAEGSSASALLHRRVRALADDHRASTRLAQRLDDRVAALEVRVRHWAAETDALTGPGAPSTHALTALDARVEQLVTAQRDIADEAHRALAGLERLADQFTTAGTAAAADARERDMAFQQLAERVDTRRSDIEALIQRLEHTRYRQLIRRIHNVVSRTVPRGAIVAVVSRGDDELLAFEGRKGWHFPQTDSGVYAGHHPADSDATVAQLEQLRGRGARYLLVPRTASWWFEHYRAFHEHLLRRYTCAFRDERTCTLFDIRGRTRRQ